MAESLGWFRGDELVGAALVLYRQLPGSSATSPTPPKGPVIDWDTEQLSAWLAPMTAHLRDRGVRSQMGPPVVTRRWTAAQVKEGIADPAVRRLGDLPPTERDATGARVAPSSASSAGVPRSRRAASPRASRSTSSRSRSSTPTGTLAPRRTSSRG